MQCGLFMMPMHLPEKPLAQAFDEDIDLLIRADALGYHEAWIGKHFTSAWESIPAPDLPIARIVPHNQHMWLGTGVVLLQFHHPVLIANRLAYLDHLTKGRFYFGFGSTAVRLRSEERPAEPCLLGAWCARSRLQPTGGFEPWPMVTPALPKCSR